MSSNVSKAVIVVPIAPVKTKKRPSIITKIVLGVEGKITANSITSAYLSARIINGIRKLILRVIEIMTAAMGRKSNYVAKKLEIVQKSNETGNVKGTAEVCEVQTWQARVIGKLKCKN